MASNQDDTSIQPPHKFPIMMSGSLVLSRLLVTELAASLLVPQPHLRMCKVAKCSNSAPTSNTFKATKESNNSAEVLAHDEMIHCLVPLKSQGASLRVISLENHDDSKGIALACFPIIQPPRTTLPGMHIASVGNGFSRLISRPPQGTFRNPFWSFSWMKMQVNAKSSGTLKVEVLPTAANLAYLCSSRKPTSPLWQQGQG